MCTNYVSEIPGMKRTRPELLEVNAETILALPDFFTLDLTEAVTLPSSYCYKAPYESQTPQMLTHETLIPHYIEEEHTWLKYAAKVVNSSADETPDDLGLTSFVFQSRQEGSVKPHDKCTVNGIFPLLFEQPNTALMQKHCIDLETAAKNVLNPDQKLTVDVSDAPLYALSKQIQFSIPGYDLTTYLPMMGDLHVEQVLTKVSKFHIFPHFYIKVLAINWLCDKEIRFKSMRMRLINNILIRIFTSVWRGL